MHPLKIGLLPKEDRDGQTYYIGKLQFNGTLDFSKGQAFLVFLEGELKQVHIAPLTCPEFTNIFNYYSTNKRKTFSRHNNIAVELEERFENIIEENRSPRKFFVGKIQTDIVLDCSQEIVFLVFTADIGEEELQISCAKHRG
jgi:hypothetical protein